MDNLVPRDLITLLYMAVATSLGWIGGWITRRKREPIELEKVRAETRQIHVTTENSQASIGLETLRELQTAIQKAEDRREEWQLKEEQLRGQVFHWRCKCEDLDGQLVDSRNANAQYETRSKLHEYQIKKLKSLLDYHNISYAELDRPRTGSGK